MNVEVRDDGLKAIVDPDVDVEKIGSGYEFTEGPIWHPVEKHLIFSDMPGDHMRKWTPDGNIETYRKPSNMANGNCYDATGGFVTCEHATSQVSRTATDGSIEVLATHYDGKELNSPNDIIVKSDGAVYFTDPTYGRLEYYGVLRDPELDFQGVYRIAPDNNELTLLVDDFAQPNGLCFSLDEAQLFINDTDRMHIRCFDVNGDGAISNNRIWAETTGEGEGAPDGLKIDSLGNVYCCGPAGIHVFSPDAKCLGVIRIPEVCANFNWGEDDLCSLFACASTSLYRVRVKVPGRKAF